MRSPDPTYQRLSSPRWKPYTRECSRNRPTTDTTRMFSLTPSMPMRRQQMPRTFRSIRTPACEARYSASMQRLSVSEFIFMTIRACWPASCAATVRSISRRIPSRRCTGETSALRKSCGRAWPVSELNMSVTSAAMAGSAVKRPKSS